jgi:hypothetical protein
VQRDDCSRKTFSWGKMRSVARVENLSDVGISLDSSLTDLMLFPI